MGAICPKIAYMLLALVIIAYLRAYLQGSNTRHTRGVVTAVGWYVHWPNFGRYSLSEEQLLFTKMCVPFEVPGFLRPAFDQFLAYKEFSTTATKSQQQRHIPERWRATELMAILPRRRILKLFY